MPCLFHRDHTQAQGSLPNLIQLIAGMVLLFQLQIQTLERIHRFCGRLQFLLLCSSVIIEILIRSQSCLRIDLGLQQCFFSRAVDLGYFQLGVFPVTKLL